MSGHQSDQSQQPRRSDAFSRGADQISTEVSASQDEANRRAASIVQLEVRRKQGPSTGRLLLTLMHKYGYSADEAEAAVQYLRDNRKELGIPSTSYTDKETRKAFRKFRENLRQKVGADLKSEFGQMPPFTARLKARPRLKASILNQDVVTAMRLMARSTPVTRVALAGQQSIRQALTVLGYSVKTTLTRAFYDMEFRKDDRVFHLIGWHGTGIYGHEKSVLEFLDERVSKTRPVVTIGVINEDNVTPANQERVVSDILEYIKENE